MTVVFRRGSKFTDEVVLPNINLAYVCVRAVVSWEGVEYRVPVAPADTGPTSKVTVTVPRGITNDMPDGGVTLAVQRLSGSAWHTIVDRAGASTGPRVEVPSGGFTPSWYGAHPDNPDNSAELQAWLRNTVVRGEPGVFAYSKTLEATWGQSAIFDKMELVYTGDDVAIAFRRTSKCWWHGLNLVAENADTGVLFTTVEGEMEGACTFNVLVNPIIRGGGRSATKPSFSDFQDGVAGTVGVYFDWQNNANETGVAICYFNRVEGGIVDRWDTPSFCRDRGDPALHPSGANANVVRDVVVQNSWYGHVVGGLENVIADGFCNHSSGVDGSNLFTHVLLGPQAYANDIVLPTGEPGPFSQPIYCMEGSVGNSIKQHLVSNFPYSSEDYGTRNTVSVTGQGSWYRSFIGLSGDGTYYRIKLGRPPRNRCTTCEVSWDSFSIGQDVRGSGTFRFVVEADSSYVPTYVEVLGATVDRSSGAGHARPAGIDVIGDVLYLVVHVDGAAGANARFDCEISNSLLGGEAWNRQQDEVVDVGYTGPAYTAP